MKRIFLILAFLLALSGAANATCSTGTGTCFWVGGTGTLDLAADSAHWSNTSGGATCSCEPPNTGVIILTFDGSSGGGTVTVNVNLNVANIVADAFTGTLDWSAHNNNVTTAANSAGFSMSGSATHTLNMGSGTWTINGQSTTTTITIFTVGTDSALTLSAANVNLVFPAQTGNGTRAINLGGTAHTWGTITFSQQTSKNGSVSLTAPAGTTITNLNIGGGVAINFAGAVTLTNLTVSGVAGLPAMLTGSAGGTTGPITVTTTNPVSDWGIFREITFSGGSATFTNCSDLLGNTFGSNTCVAPVVGGGGPRPVIGGFLLKRDLSPDNDNGPAFIDRAA